MQTSAPPIIALRGLGSRIGSTASVLVSWSTVPLVVAMALAAAALVTPAATGRGDLGQWPWLVGTVAAVVVDHLARSERLRRLEPIAGPAWLVIVAMVATLGGASALRAAAVTAAVVVAVDVVRRRSIRTAAGRFVALALPAAVFAVAASMAVPGSPGAGFVGGIAAAGTALVLTRVVLPVLDPTVFPSAPSPRHLAAEIGEWMMLGAGAGVIGAVLPTSEWIVMPILIAGLVAIVAADLMRRQTDAVVEQAVESLLAALEAKDLYTRGHAERVGLIAGAVGREMGIEGAPLHRLVTAARLHDIGKLAVPRQLLRKAGRLTDAEYCRVQRHTEVVAEILADIPALAPTIPIIEEHHHHVDGSGYVEGADPVVPSLSARILAAADAFDAMTTHRRYRKALSTSYALGELRRNAGTQFDAEVVESLVRVVERSDAPPPGTGAETDETARAEAERVMVDVAH